MGAIIKIRKNMIFRITILLFFQFLLMIKCSYGQPYSRIDSLEKVLQTIPAKGEKVDTTRINLLIELSFENHKSNPDKGILFGEEALQLSQKLSWNKGIVMAQNRIGLNYWAKSEYPKSLEYHFRALKLGEESGFKQEQAIVLGNIGLTYESQRNYPKALDYHFRALKMNQELNDTSGIARNLGNIGIVYDAQGNFINSLKYYSDALHLYEKLNDQNGVARNLGNIGFVYQQQNIFDKALSYNYKALQMNEALGNTILKAMNLGNIGAAYLGIYAEPDATKFQHYPDSLKKQTAAIKAEKYLNNSITIFKEINDLNSLQELYGYLSDLQLFSKNYKEALLSFKQQVAYRNSLYNDNNERKIAQLEKDREEDLKQKEIALLKSQNEVERLTAQRSRAISYGLAGAFVFLFIVTVGFFNQSKKRKKMNLELQAAYIDLKNAQNQLVKSEKMAAFGTLASRVAHEIQNPLNFVNNFSEMSDELVKELSSEELSTDQKETLNLLSENLQKIHHHGNRANQIVKQLQQHINEGTAHEFFEEE